MRSQRILVALMAAALVVAGCGREGGATETEGGPAAAVSGDFGDLSGICGPGDARGATAQGVTDTQIQVGVFSDMGFTKNPEFDAAAQVFTSWCNEAGGINGRTLTYEIRDSRLTEVRQRMLDACREDFFLVGGGSALDGLGVKDRLSCLLPEFPGQVAQIANIGSDLQLAVGASAAENVNPYTGFQQWLIDEAHPGSGEAIGIINGDSPVTKAMGPKMVESLRAHGARIVYDELYPASGVADWTPYAQAIKSRNVRGLIFFGDFRSLAKLEDVLTGMDYRLDWIDANANAYNPEFVELAADSLAAQNNYADLSGIAPLDAADRVPAVRQVLDLYQRYAPDAAITFPALKAFSAWVLFAKSATACGDRLTRACVFDNARQETAWTGGGLLAPVDLSTPLSDQPRCFNVQKATPDGWRAVDFGATDGVYRCGVTPYRYATPVGAPMTLADVGKSLADLE
ncbi:MAG TPA: ABC transporter substrate-binding protein [Nocardia sp.]|uniref:ABC transporter substrate-binding protein n=1 Tax=Nocardia sp. TaxID=1821 RepID=UPI002B4B38A5|nr:ABC transporter substrate-binding protein [Nocardia sp.]HLS75511.1 ABC transporter substrate-binding protein [Nocardia sp.]